MASGYSKQIVLLVEALEGEVQRERDALALEIVDELSKSPPIGTPVRTGWARANWVPALSTPHRSFKTRGGSEPTESDVKRAAAAKEQAIAQLLLVGPSLPYALAYVSNGVAYINRLNEGHSPQTAAGFIERAIERAVATRQQVQSFSSWSPGKGPPRP